MLDTQQWTSVKTSLKPVDASQTRTCVRWQATAAASLVQDESENHHKQNKNVIALRFGSPPNLILLQPAVQKVDLYLRNLAFGFLSTPDFTLRIKPAT